MPRDAKTVLDVGCSMLQDGNPKSEDMLFSVFEGTEITAIDAFPDCVEWRKRNGPPGNYLVMGARGI